MYNFLLFVYNFFITIFRWGFSLFIIFLNKNSPWHERLKVIKKTTSDNIIWIHASSVGEVLSIKKLMVELHKFYPNYEIIITSHTVTSKEIIKKMDLHFVKHHFLPLDSIGLVNKFLNIYNPKIVLWLEQDFLPIFLHKINQAQIPLYLLNARISSNSARRWQKAKFVSNKILYNFTKILAMSMEDKERLQQLTDKNIEYVGNLKITNLNIADKIQVLQNNIYQKLQQLFRGRKIFVALSTHDDEESNIFNMHRNLSKNIDNLLTIIIPRHINRCEDIATVLNLQNKAELPLKMLTYSQIKLCFNKEDNDSKSHSIADLILVDTMGMVDIFCALAKVIFVGKSLSSKYKGGHNILEPLSLKKAVIVGDNINNFKEVVNLCLVKEALIKVSNFKELEKNILYIFNNDNVRLNLENNSDFIYQDAQNILTNYINMIKVYL